MSRRLVAALIAVAAVVWSLLVPVSAQADPARPAPTDLPSARSDSPLIGGQEAAPTLTRSATAKRKVRRAGIDEVAAGGEFSCGISGAPAGALYCWGRNSFGQLGSGEPNDGAVAPTQVGRGSKWTQVSAGGSTTCGILTNGSLRCWGLNHRGQVGDGGSSPVLRPKKVASKRPWAQVSTGWFHTCAVRTDGRLYCWGDNSNGQLGSGNTQGYRKPHRVPGKDWSSVSVGGWSTCATRTNGKLSCWGRNVFGQLGIGDTRQPSTPTQVMGKKTRWRSVSLSWSHTCGITRSSQVRCWGRNDRGQVGQGLDLYVLRPQKVPGDHRATSVAAAEAASCLVDDAGKLWCWGDNRFGQIAPGQPLDEAQGTPRRRAGSYTAVSGGWFHFCGANAKDKAVCWGDNQRGQLGDTRASAPQPADLEPAVPGNGGPLAFRLATLNVLGNNHTRPGAGSDRFGPSRIRADWSAQAIINNGIDVVGIQEPDSGQVAAILEGASGRLAAYPEPVEPELLPETTILWDTQQFELVDTDSVLSQFIARKIRRPIVRLRQISTGREFWVLNTHNAPNAYQTKRNKAVRVQVKKIAELEATGLPVFYVGDFNEKETVLCKVLAGTGLGSPLGGKVKPDGTCKAPGNLRIDQLFGPSDAQWQGYVVGFPPLVRMSTDHPMVMADVTVP